MKIASVATTKNELSRMLRYVKSGETVVITERNRPIARLLPMDSAKMIGVQEIDSLVASGALLPPAGPALDVKAFLAAPRGRLTAEHSLARAIQEERDEGR